MDPYPSSDIFLWFWFFLPHVKSRYYQHNLDLIWKTNMKRITGFSFHQINLFALSKSHYQIVTGWMFEIPNAFSVQLLSTVIYFSIAGTC